MLDRLVIALLVATALAGCTSSDGPSSGTQIRIVDSEVIADMHRERDVPCAGSAELAVVATAGTNGTFSVTVRDGQGIPLFSKQYAGTEGHDETTPIGGSQGQWLLRADKSQEFNGGFTITLTCS